MKNKIYKTTKEIRDKFIKDGWSENIDFSILTLDEAIEKGYLFAIDEIQNGKTFFKMNGNGNIYYENGKLACYNI